MDSNLLEASHPQVYGDAKPTGNTGTVTNWLTLQLAFISIMFPEFWGLRPIVDPWVFLCAAGKPAGEAV